MSVELLQTLSLVAYIVSCILLVLTIILFFVLRIPQVVGDLTGIVRKREIAGIRQHNEATGNEKSSTDVVNKARGRLTDKLTDSGRLVQTTGRMHSGMNTQKISTSILREDAQKSMQQSRETTLLPQNGGETTELSQSTFTVETELGFCESSELIE